MRTERWSANPCGRGRVCRLLAVSGLVGALGVTLMGPAWGGEGSIGPDMVARLGEVLAGRRVDDVVVKRGFGDVYRRSVRAVPLVVSPGGFGSAAVIEVNPSDRTAWVVTNHHVVARPFRDERGRAVVLLLFYEPQLASEPFSEQRMARCRLPVETGEWCQGFRRARRPALVVDTDPARDLAFLLVGDVPQGVQPIRDGRIDAVQTGDEVAVIGHPLDLLWSLTVGVVSAVRSQFPMGKPPRVIRSTVIQTQAPVNPGNSGGPLLAKDGGLVGVVFGRVGLAAKHGPEAPDEPEIPQPGLSFAIAVNEVRAFVAEQAESLGRR